MGIETMISGHDLFRALTSEEVRRISEYASTRGFKRYDVIYRHDGRVTHVFLNLEGRVDLQLPAQPGGVEVAVGRVGKGELFGVAPLLGEDRYTTTAIAAGPAEVLAIEARPLRAVLDENPVAGAQIIRQVARVYFGRYLDLLRGIQGVASQLPLAR